MSRRALLFILGAVAVVLVVVFFRFRWRLLVQLLFPPRDSPRGPTSRPDPFRQRGRAQIVLVTGGDAYSRVKRCLDLLDAEGRLALRGQRVLVKPNVVAGMPAPTTTSPEVVAAVCCWLRDRGAETVWVGDMAAVMTLGTRGAMRSSGIEAAAREAGAIPVYFEEHPWVPVNLPGARHLNQVPVSEYVVTADLMVNLPVLKTHNWATYSACLKNFVGATHGRYRPYMIDSDHWEEIVAELNLAYRPDLNLVDGTRIMVAGGPRWGEVAEMELLIAGGDRVACDAVAVALLKTFDAHPKLRDRSVWEERQIAHARRLGLGVAGPDEMDLDIHHLEPPSPELRDRLEEMQTLLAVI